MLEAYDTLLQMTVPAKQALSDDEKHFRYECLCCGEEVFVAAQGSVYKVPHFRHRSGNNDKKCELYLSQYGSISVSPKNRHNKQEHLDFYFDNVYKHFCAVLCFNNEELDNYEANNTDFEIRSEKHSHPFFSKKIDRQHFCENTPETFILEKYATPYYVSNTLNNRKREYLLFGYKSPTFFKIQGDGEDYKAKYVKSKYIYTNVRYFVAWVGSNIAQIKLKGKQGVQIEDQFDFVTMGNWTVYGMVVTFKNKNSELDELLQSWGYNLSVSEDLLLLWPPSFVDDDTNYIPYKEAFVYSTFNIQYGNNSNIPDKYINHISSNITEITDIQCQDTARIIQKNAEITLKLDGTAVSQNTLGTSTAYEKIVIIPKCGTYYKFTNDGVEKLNEGEKVILTPHTVVVEFQNNYPIKKIFYKNHPNIALEARINDILSNFWVCEKYSGEYIEKFSETTFINDYLLRCKQKKCINSAIIKILKEE